MTTLLDMRHYGPIITAGTAPKTTKQDLVIATAKMCRMTQADCQLAIEVLLSVITGRLAKGRTLQIRGFGTLWPHSAAARTGRNVRTGEAVAIPAQKTVKMRFPKNFLTQGAGND